MLFKRGENRFRRELIARRTAVSVAFVIQGRGQRIPLMMMEQ